MSCSQEIPYISRRVAHQLACDLSINLDLISLEQWQDSLQEESGRSWDKYCNIYGIAEKVRDNLLNNLNHYSNLGLGSKPFRNPAIVQPSVICNPGGRVNWQNLIFSPY